LFERSNKRGGSELNDAFAPNRAATSSYLRRWSLVGGDPSTFMRSVMSVKTKLKNQMREASDRAGGSYATRRARNGFIGMLVTTLFLLGFPVTSVNQIGVRAIKAFIDFRKKAGKNTRTIQNDMSFIKTIFRRSGREQFAREPLLTNEALGISGASRRGTKQAPTDDEYDAILERAKDEGLRALLMLCRWLGLREQEAILSFRSLKEWEKTLRTGGTHILVIWGTKGGRPRHARIFNMERALRAVQCALGVLASGRRLAPKTNLKSAVKWFDNATHRRKIRGHALRYAYAQDAVDIMKADGHTESEAYALAGMYLGHGDGRGRMIKLVYGTRSTTPSPANPPLFLGG